MMFYKVIACNRNLINFFFLTHMRFSFALTHFFLCSSCLRNPVCRDILLVIPCLEVACSACVPAVAIVGSMVKMD